MLLIGKKIKFPPTAIKTGEGGEGRRRLRGGERGGKAYAESVRKGKGGIEGTGSGNGRRRKRREWAAGESETQA